MSTFAGVLEAVCGPRVNAYGEVVALLRGYTTSPFKGVAEVIGGYTATPSYKEVLDTISGNPCPSLSATVGQCVQALFPPVGSFSEVMRRFGMGCTPTFSSIIRDAMPIRVTPVPHVGG